MNKESILAQLNKFKEDYKLDNIIEDLTEYLLDYDLEIGNIVCMFIYKKEDYIELSFMTCPNKIIPRYKIYMRM